jgi:hypothetical protein
MSSFAHLSLRHPHTAWCAFGLTGLWDWAGVLAQKFAISQPAVSAAVSKGGETYNLICPQTLAKKWNGSNNTARRFVTVAPYSDHLFLSQEL